MRKTEWSWLGRLFVNILVEIFFTYIFNMCLCLVSQSCPILCHSMDCSPRGSSVREILQARILEWVSMPSSRLSSQPRGRTQVSCIAGGFGFFTIWATREAYSSCSEIITTIKPINILVTSTEFGSVQFLSCVQLFAAPWSAACQTSLSITNSWSLLRLTSIKSVIPSNHLILCHPLLLLPSSYHCLCVCWEDSS